MAKARLAPAGAPAYYAYILECSDKTLYVGCTSDLKKRLRAHNGRKSGAHYTKIRRPVVLKYQEGTPTLSQARAREAALKRLTRTQKLSLIENGGGARNKPGSPA